MRASATGVLCLALACSPPVEETSSERAVEEVLETAIGAGHVAALTMSALEGDVAPCLHVVTPCSGVGCSFTFEIDTGTCPLPISADGGGLLVVAGVWSAQESAVITGGYADIGTEWVVLEIGSMVVTRSDPQTVTVAWAQQDVEIRDGADSASVQLTQHAWVVEVGTSGTKDPADDSYVVSGGHQEAGAGGGASTLQIAIANATVTPACRRNPTAGTAVLQGVNAGSTVGIDVAVMTFHSACDGQPFDLTN